jgi:hypothetical protein
MIRAITFCAAVAVSAFAMGQTTQPATQPAVTPAAQMLDQMLRPSGQPSAKPLRPVTDAPAVDRSTGSAAVAPGAEAMSLQREGTFVIDRIGRITRSADGQTAEFIFESDGKAMQDPPVIILPNLKLMAIESAMKSSSRDLRFRITGMLTEYNGRNYVLLDKVLVMPEQ